MKPVLIFDLSGVLVGIRGPESLAELSGGRITREDFFRFWSVSPWAHRIHLGACTPHEFAVGAVEELGLAIMPEAFLENFRSWLQGPYPGALDLLARLRPRYAIACLSNAHEIDVARFRGEFDLTSYFDRCFFSNEMQLRKPDPECYRSALRDLNVSADQALFFDDGAENVEGARAVGMRAYLTDGLDALRTQLIALGIVQ